jgi:apolipoprotein N-acyltransferase
MSKYLLLIFAGIITPFAFPPFDIVPTIFIGHTILFILIIKSSNYKQAFIFGLVFGISEYLFGFYWLFSIIEGYQLGYQITMSVIILGIIALISLFIGLSALVIRKFYLKNMWWYMLFPASLFTIFEWFKSWLFTGFPWYSASDALSFAGVYSLLPIIGYLGVGFIFYAFIGLISAIFIHNTKKYYLLLTLYILVISILTITLKDINWTTDYKTISARIITGNYAKSQIGNRAASIERFNKYFHLSNTEPTTDITVWPESTISVDYQDIAPHLKNTKSDKTTIFTGLYYKKYGKSTNTIFSLDDNKPVYYKEHLIPFGEYTPYWFSLFKSLIPNLNMDDLTLVKNGKTFNYQDITIYGSICYEALFSEELLARSKDANLHIHVSDLGWFDNTTAVDYLLNVLRIRAIETSKPVIYSVNHGYSAFINNKGKIQKIQTKDGVFAMDDTITTQQGITPYERYKNYPLLVFISIILLVFVGRYFRNNITKNNAE